LAFARRSFTLSATLLFIEGSTSMTDSSKRDEWDRHNRDEAKERAVQQEAAGMAYRPVLTEPYANLSGAPEARDAELDIAALAAEYERSADAERVAWLAVRDLVAHERDLAAWNAWRDAVERTQQAARSLVNHKAAARR
jgi:hypothetical protein